MTRLETIYEDVDLEAGRSPSPPPEQQKKKRGRRSWCLRLVCFALLLLAAAAALAGALYLALDPKLPVYTVHAVNVTAFDMDAGASSLAVWFRGYRLAEGAFPAFYQGHRDASLVRVHMGEASLSGTGVVEAMRHVNGGGGELPLVFTGEVPVRVKVGPVTTSKVTPRVRCDLVLDRLNTEGSVRVKNMDCKFSIKLW
ncbi:hypothetical protein QOZ80_2BG0187210 [Eleusine coracana subsp. coracana]|nr:hypothetical protein QOZ80_2BG0187210 [Eleusine coracana subsp. coracana]